MCVRSDRRIQLIESWFQAHEDGEFAILPAEHATAILSDPEAARTLVYTTKAECAARLAGSCGFAEPVSMVSRYGLPSASDAALLESLADRTACVFFGDADPPDILVFAWLEQHVPIQWRGVSDAVLLQFGHRDLKAISIPMSAAEKDTVPLLNDLCPDFRKLLGPQCAAILERGFKVELEAVLQC